MDHSEERETLLARLEIVYQKLAALDAVKEWDESCQREHDRLVQEKLAIQNREVELLPPLPEINWNRLSEILDGIKPKKSEPGIP